MRKLLYLLLFLVLTIVLLLVVATRGSGRSDTNDPGDPIQVIRAVFKAIENKEFEKIPNYVCEGQRAAIAQALDMRPAIAAALGEGVDPQLVLDAIAFKVTRLEISQVSRIDGRATLHVRANLDFEVDAEKFKDLMREMLKGTQGVSNDTLNLVATQALQGLETAGQSFDGNFQVVKMGERWLICK